MGRQLALPGPPVHLPIATGTRTQIRPNSRLAVPERRVRARTLFNLGPVVSMIAGGRNIAIRRILVVLTRLWSYAPCPPRLLLRKNRTGKFNRSTVDWRPSTGIAV